MRAISSMQRITCLLIAGVAIQIAGVASAGASVITTSPTLPLLGVPYTSAVGAGCFPAVATCIQPGTLTFTTPVSSSFNGAGQDITSGAIYNGVLTDINHVPTGSTITLTGSLEQEVLGRTTDIQTGSWDTQILALTLSGPFQGHTLALTLSASPDSTGHATITQIGGGSTNVGDEKDGQFEITSFFDVFVDLTLDTPNPLHASRGPLEFNAGVPEPASLMVLATALIGLRTMRRRRPTAQ